MWLEWKKGNLIFIVLKHGLIEQLDLSLDLCKIRGLDESKEVEISTKSTWEHKELRGRNKNDYCLPW
jgi:hypothetical protein